MEFRLLGPLEVRAGDGPLPLGGEKQRALLALLLLNANRVVSRERLIDELWGEEEPPETAVTTIQVYVSRLRKVLANGVLSTQAPGYVLAVEPPFAAGTPSGKTRSMPLYSFDPVEAEIFARRRRTGPLLEEILRRRQWRRTAMRRPAALESLAGQRTAARRAA